MRVHKSYIINMDKIEKIKGLGNRSYEVNYYGYKEKAYLSRSKYNEYGQLLRTYRLDKPV